MFFLKIVFRNNKNALHVSAIHNNNNNNLQINCDKIFSLPVLRNLPKKKAGEGER